MVWPKRVIENWPNVVIFNFSFFIKQFLLNKHNLFSKVITTQLLVCSTDLLISQNSHLKRFNQYLQIRNLLRWCFHQTSKNLNYSQIIRFPSRRYLLANKILVFSFDSFNIHEHNWNVENIVWHHASEPGNLYSTNNTDKPMSHRGTHNGKHIKDFVPLRKIGRDGQKIIKIEKKWHLKIRNFLILFASWHVPILMEK